MKFLREIPIERMTEEQKAELIKQGYKLVVKEESIEVWATCSEDATDGE